MFFGDDQEMNRFDRIDIRKNHNILILVGKFFRNFLPRNSAKNTIIHSNRLEHSAKSQGFQDLEIKTTPSAIRYALC